MTCKYSMEELIPIVADLSVKYTSGESTSVTYDKARQFMGAVQYAILIYERNAGNRNALSAGNKIPARTAYERGYQLLCEKVKRAQKRYNQMIPHFVSFENENYEATVVQGIPAFFLYYDPKFAPADTIITMDYPVVGGVKFRQGILAVDEYIRKIELEQIFFAGLSMDYGYQVLNSQREDYKEQFYNICGILLKDILMRMMLQKNQIEPEQLESYLQHHSKEELEEELRTCLHTLVVEKYESNLELETYLGLSIKDYMAEFYFAYHVK